MIIFGTSAYLYRLAILMLTPGRAATSPAGSVRRTVADGAGCRESVGKPAGALGGFVRRPFAHCWAASGSASTACRVSWTSWRVSSLIGCPASLVRRRDHRRAPDGGSGRTGGGPAAHANVSG
ncbi:hypothetical protein ACFV2Z_22530 [Streptomyces sp. NPDC059688]|uniref:hypothetical protein n=1 Tax=Streptomyces sp. NPDC059688 TaxID=3346906 RepID=UPI00367D3716